MTGSSTDFLCGAVLEAILSLIDSEFFDKSSEKKCSFTETPEVSTRKLRPIHVQNNAPQRLKL